MVGSTIIVVGSANCDVTVRVRELPCANQTVLGQSSSITGGGKGINQAVAAAAIGAQVHFVSAVGDDYFGSRILRYLERASFSTKFVRSVDSCASGTAVITVDDEGRNCIAVSPGANANVGPDLVAAAFNACAQADALLVQLEIPLPSVAAALEAARSRKVLTILNPAPANSAVLEYLPLVDILTPNEHELAELAGMPLAEIESGAEGLERALSQLQSLSGGIIVVTRGDAGCVAFDGANHIRTPAFEVPVIDTTGAGDVFNGALAALLGAGVSLIEAMREASAAAAISVSRGSAQDSAPNRAEVEELLSSDPLVHSMRRTGVPSQ